MKTCFIFPGITDIGFNSFGNTTLGLATCLIHHGLCSLSACIKQAGFPAELIDLRKMRNWRHFRKELESRNPDVVAATMWSVDYDIALRCLKIAKEVNPKVITMVGGIHPTVATAELEQEKYIDYIMCGEGEIALPKLLRSLEAGEAGERVIVGEKPNLDEIPFIDRELFDYEVELNNPFLGSVYGFQPPFVTIITSRGCKYNCRFCQPSERILFGKQVRQRSVENVITELKQLRDKYNFKSLMVHDDAFTQNIDWVMEFCRQYRANGFNQPFWAQSRADFICQKEELLAELARTGLRALSIGFESGNDRVLRFLRKGVTVEQNYRAAEICRKYGIEVHSNFMFGIPTETNAEVMDTVRAIKAMKLKFVGYSIYTPLPGSELDEYCNENNLSLIDNHARFNRSEFTPKIKGVDYRFIARAIEEALELSGWQKVAHRLRRNQFLDQTLRKLAHHQPFQALFLWLRQLLYRW